MNRSDIVDEVLLSQLPDNVFMRGQDFGALPDDSNLGFSFAPFLSKVGSGLSKVGSFAAKAGGAIATAAPKALPSLIDIGSQFAQFKMQKDIAKAQAGAQNAYNDYAAKQVSLPTGSGSNPYSQPTSSSFMTQQVAGIPVWALGAGAVGVIALIMILRRK